jgi:hypothetical protein
MFLTNKEQTVVSIFDSSVSKRKTVLKINSRVIFTKLKKSENPTGDLILNTISQRQENV